MACLSSEDAKTDKLIGVEIQKERRYRGNSVDLLLLGRGCSTVVKQLRMLSLGNLPEWERLAYKPLIAQQILATSRTLINHARRFGYQFSDANQNSLELIESLPLTEQITIKIGDAITRVWEDSAIQQAFSRSSEFDIPESTLHFMTSIPRISDPAYVPDDHDVLRTEEKYNNMIGETIFDYSNCHFKLVDVTKLHTTKRKWLHCFEDVMAILYCIDLSSYDKINEDGTNKMHAAIQDFKEICACKWFDNAAFLMFYNRNDILKEKIESVPLSVCFPQFQGDQTYEAAKQYITNRFREVDNNSERLFYNHFTWGNDRESMAFVFSAVKDIVLARAIARKIKY